MTNVHAYLLFFGLSRSGLLPQPNPGHYYTLQGKPCMSAVICMQHVIVTNNGLWHFLWHYNRLRHFLWQYSWLTHFPNSSQRQTAVTISHESMRNFSLWREYQYHASWKKMSSIAYKQTKNVQHSIWTNKKTHTIPVSTYKDYIEKIFSLTLSETIFQLKSN